MSGIRLKFNRLGNIPSTSSLQETLPFDQAFDIEYKYGGEWNLIMVKPIIVHSVVIFLIQFPEREGESMALVYNTKDEWSDIEKESTGETEAIGQEIEKYYSKRYLLSGALDVLN